MIVCNIQNDYSCKLCSLSNEQLQYNVWKPTLLPSSGDREWETCLLWLMPAEKLLSPIGPVTESSSLCRVHKSMCVFHTRLETEQDFKHCVPNYVRKWIKSERIVFLNCTFILFHTFVSDMKICLDFCPIIFPPPSWKSIDTSYIKIAKLQTLAHTTWNSTKLTLTWALII
jgi:hypothetical protein